MDLEQMDIYWNFGEIINRTVRWVSYLCREIPHDKMRFWTRNFSEMYIVINPIKWNIIGLHQDNNFPRILMYNDSWAEISLISGPKKYKSRFYVISYFFGVPRPISLYRVSSYTRSREISVTKSNFIVGNFATQTSHGSVKITSEMPLSSKTKDSSEIDFRAKLI